MAEASVSTHSRLKAAGAAVWRCFDFGFVSTPSRLKAAGDPTGQGSGAEFVSTHSRLKAAGRAKVLLLSEIVFQHTAA